jgi:hypothetical protein
MLKRKKLKHYLENKIVWHIYDANIKTHKMVNYGRNQTISD